MYLCVSIEFKQNLIWRFWDFYSCMYACSYLYSEQKDIWCSRFYLYLVCFSLHVCTSLLFYMIIPNARSFLCVNSWICFSGFHYFTFHSSATRTFSSVTKLCICCLLNKKRQPSVEKTPSKLCRRHHFIVFLQLLLENCSSFFHFWCHCLAMVYCNYFSWW